MKFLEPKDWYKKTRIERTIKSLRKNEFEVFYFNKKEEAVNKIMELIPLKATVGIGGSVTLRQLDIPEKLRKRGNKTEDHWFILEEKGISSQNSFTTHGPVEVRRNQLNSDVFITSTNAITENGELINIDGAGQRVAAMIFGPKKVIVVAGINKLTRDLEEGLWRAKNIAASINAKRFNKATPCTITGICSDCDSPDRVCGTTTIIHRKMRYTPLTIILIDEDLGY
jgi:hypothetical protein